MTELTYDNYREVLEYEIQEQVSQPKTFLQIAQQPHYENVISNILAFFFDTSEEHGLEDLFLSSLLELIREQGVDFCMNECVAEREFGERVSGRINILLSNDTKDKFIIIENKIYHFLNNGLDDYYHAIGDDASQKIGVLLSLEPTTPRHPKFVNITHQEFSDRILKNLGRFYLRGNDKYLYLLKDYVQNINQLYLTSEMKEKLSFFFEHHQKIDELVHLQYEVINHVKDQVKRAADDLGYRYSGGRGKSYLYWEFLEQSSPLNGKVYYSIWLTELHKHEKPQVNISLTFDKLGDEVVRTVMEAGFTSDKGVHFLDTLPDHHWIDFAWKSYELTEDQLQNLTAFLTEVTQRDFEPIKNQLLTILTKSQK